MFGAFCTTFENCLIQLQSWEQKNESQTVVTLHDWVEKNRAWRNAKVKKCKKLCFIGIGLLPLMLASCGTNNAKNDSRKNQEKMKNR